MKIRAQLLTSVLVLVLAGTAGAQPGTAYLQAKGGAMIPVGSFHHQQEVGGAYSIAAGYEFTEFFDMLLEFTHSFNDTDDFHYTAPNFEAFSDETAQTFVVSMGPRINFASSDYPVRPYLVTQVGWYHFATFNSIDVNGASILDDEDQDAVGIQGGLGIEGTVLEVAEHRGDEYPILEMTLGVQGVFHHAFQPNRADKQFVTTMATLGFRF